MSVNLSDHTFPPFIIAIDGHSSCGKSTLAKGLAHHFNLSYIDTGAMYRAVTLYMLQHDISISEISNHLDEISISFTDAGSGNRMILNGIDEEDEIRSPKVNHQVSEVARLKDVRTFLVDQQRKMGELKNVILEGRDIGTVVFPDANVKIFVTASSSVRAKRRYLEFLSKGIQQTLEEVQENLNHRDHIDSSRKHSPLKKADDAAILDNSHLNKSEQLEKAIIIVQKALGVK